MTRKLNIDISDELTNAIDKGFPPPANPFLERAAMDILVHGKGPKMYCKRPITVQAMQWNGTVHMAKVIGLWSEGKAECRFVRTEPRDNVPLIFIWTREGEMRANPGDWIVKGIAGEFYPVKDDIFRQTYDETDSTD